MVTKFAKRHCDKCEKRTRHKIETNSETGWRRERCMPCWDRGVQGGEN